MLHLDARSKDDERRAETKQVLANCAPQVLARMLPQAERETFDEAYNGRPLSTSLFSAHFGLSRPPSELGLDRYILSVFPDWAKSSNDLRETAGLLAGDPGDRMPGYGITNYGAIDSGLDSGGPTLVTVAGLDRLENWSGLAPQEEKDRRERWLDAFQAALDRDYPGFSAAVTERMFLNARSMANYLNTPGGAVYGFAPEPFERGILGGYPRTPKTPLPGVFLASSFGQSGGFSGAMNAGADAARLAMKERAR